MLGRVILVVTLGVAAALLGSFSLLDRLPASTPVVAPVPTAIRFRQCRNGRRSRRAR
jgi:hypothetical protein